MRGCPGAASLFTLSKLATCYLLLAKQLSVFGEGFHFSKFYSVNVIQIIEVICWGVLEDEGHGLFCVNIPLIFML